MNISKLTPAMLAALALAGCGAGASIEWPFVLGTVTVSGDTPPTATAGPDQTVVEGDIVTLHGSGQDNQGPVRLEWRQESGPHVNLSNSAVANPTFLAPPVAQQTELRFRLRAIDSAGQIGADGVDYTSVFVDPGALPPEIVLLDFESRPDGSMPTEFEPVDADYTAVCVIFRNFDPTDLSRPPEYRRFVPTNTVVWDNDRIVNPPPETTFNVTIELTEPVASISADVYAASGTNITLRAFDDTGAETGSATSMDSTDCCDVRTGTLTLADIGWIHLVTFQSSAPDIVVPAIDNLALERRTVCD